MQRRITCLMQCHTRCLVQRRTAPHKVPGAAPPMYELLYWRERQDHRNVFGDQRDYLIAQFSSVNIYNSNLTLVAYLSVGYWIPITSYRVIVVHPMGVFRCCVSSLGYQCVTRCYQTVTNPCVYFEIKCTK